MTENCVNCNRQSGLFRLGSVRFWSFFWFSQLDLKTLGETNDRYWSRKASTEKGPNSPKCQTKRETPFIDQVDLIDTREQDIGPKGWTLRNFPPLPVVQVLWIHTDHLPSNTLFNLPSQTYSSLPCVGQSFFAVRECGDIEFWKLVNLETLNYQ